MSHTHATAPASEVYMQLLQQHVGIVKLSPTGAIVDANESFLSMFGYSLPDIRGQRHETLYGDDGAAAAEHEKLWEEIVGHDNTEHIFLCRRGDGSAFWIRAVYHALRNANGQTEQVIAFCEDISKLLMHDVQANALHLATVGHSLLVALFSMSGQCLSVNENCLHTLSLSWEDISSRNVLDMCGPVFAPGELGRLRSRLRKGESYSMRLSWPRSDGELVQLDAWFIPLLGTDQTMHRVMLLAADVTARFAHERKKAERYGFLSELIASTENAVAITDVAYKILYANSTFNAMFGHARRQLLGVSPTFVFGANEKNILDKIRMGLSSAQSVRLEETAYGRLGQKMWVSLSVNVFLDQHDRRRRIFFVFADITSAKLYEALQQAVLEGMAHDLPVPEILTLVRREVENLIPGIRILAFRADGHGALHALIPSREAHDFEAFRKITVQAETPISNALRQQHAVLVHNIRESSYPQRIKDVYAAMSIEAVLATPIYSGKRDLLGLVAFLYNAPVEQNEWHSQVADVMARVCSIAMEWGEIRTALRMFTHYNPITGLPNLNMLSALTEQAMIARALQNDDDISVAALCINIERFRRINKTWGIAAANETLKNVAQRLTGIKGPNDLVAHSLEDEFIMLSIDCGAAQARETGRRIQAALAEPLLIKNTEVVLSANIGVSMTREGVTLDEGPGRIIEEARSVLFQMQRGAHAQIHFFSAVPEQFSAEDISLEARLMHAIAEGKLHLCYQPQVALHDGSIHGVEALCRWQEADLGAVPPAKFIPLAEESGLIDQLGDWVLREVCRQLGDWRQRNVPVPVVSANLSALNFRDADLPDRILRYLGEYTLKPRDLMLELTETVLLDNDPTTLQTLHNAKAKGLRLSLDDFGTGYSSLSYLQKLPITEMKLDRSFVQDLHVNAVSQRLSKAIIRVGESLDLLVLAEGVENKQQLSLLKKHHYHVVQGYFLAKPLSPEGLERWLADWNPATIFA
ncbi:MAG: EAL domain-containing protein [Deltaproteobacteria bacterium]|nr:EAL domain-containing protein [Deltaproteobacteria bacterium]